MQMTIPKIIHQIWVGPNPMPEKSHGFIEKIKELHPGFEYRLWGNADITPENFKNYEIIMKASSYAQKSDIMRYEILYKYGGIYLDIDMEVFQNMSPLLTHDLVVCNEDENINSYMTNAFIACIAGNENLKNCVNSVPTINFSQSINVATGPYYFRRNFTALASIRVLPTKTCYPVHFTRKSEKPAIDAEVFMQHHWDKNW